MTENATKTIGKEMHSQSFVVRGSLPIDEWKAFLASIVSAVGMTPAGSAAVWEYPTVDGKGGTGWTICQPLVESFSVLDIWSDHDGAYLQISSCRKFDSAAAIAPVRRAGLVIDSIGEMETLRL